MSLKSKKPSLEGFKLFYEELTSAGVFEKASRIRKRQERQQVKDVLARHQFLLGGLLATGLLKL